MNNEKFFPPTKLSQFKRGGETLCLQNAGVHQLFSSAMAEFSPCALEGSNTRGRSLLIGEVVEREAELKEKEPVTEKQYSIRESWEKQKKKIATELEGIWSLGRR